MVRAAGEAASLLFDGSRSFFFGVIGKGGEVIIAFVEI